MRARITLLPSYRQEELLAVVGDIPGYVVVLLSMLVGLLILIVVRGQLGSEEE